MMVASSCSDRCGSVGAVLLYKVQFPSGAPVVMWRNLIFLWSPVEKGATLVSQNLCFYLGKKCWALPPGWSNFQWNEVILSVTQWDSMAMSRKWLAGGRLVLTFISLSRLLVTSVKAHVIIILSSSAWFKISPILLHCRVAATKRTMA